MRGSEVIAPHPTNVLGIGSENVRKYAHLLDCIEIFNAQLRTKSFKENKSRAMFEVFFDYRACNSDTAKLAQENSFPGIACPDSNSTQTHLAYSNLDRKPKGDELISGIRHISFVKNQIRNKKRSP